MGRLFGLFFFALPLLVLSGGAHWLVATWAMRVFPRLARFRRPAKYVIAVLVVLAPLLRVASRRTHSTILTELFAIMAIELMFVMFSLPLLAAAIGVARLVARLTRKKAVSEKVEATDTPPPEAPALARREVLERALGLAALGATGSVLGWGMIRGRHAFEVDEVIVRIKGLPKALDGYTIAQVSDIHTGIYVGERELEEGLSRIAEAKPDLIVATGDLVDFDSRDSPIVARALGALRARDGVTAILGNHDYYAGHLDVIAALRAAGVEVLVNQGRVLRAGDGGGFALLGVDDMWARRSGGDGPDLDRAIAMVPPDLPRILLAHQPNYISRSTGKVALQLSGHTHGGQINPGFRPADFFMHYVAGRYDVGDTALYVNRGFGVVGPPARIGAPPEVTKIVLVSA